MSAQLMETVSYLRDAVRPPREVRDILQLGTSLSGGQIALDYGSWSSHRFASLDDPEAIKVMVCARDEEQDLPMSLLSLAQSRVTIAPIVIDNASNDDTHAVAEMMGATVFSCEKVGKSNALKFGFQLLAASDITGSLLLTDADTIVKPDWAGHMRQLLGRPDMENGGAISGPVVFFEKRQPGLMKLKSALIYYRDRTLLHNNDSSARGANLALGGGDGYDPIQDLSDRFESDFILGEDKQIAGLVGEGGRLNAHSFDAAAVVFTRGDRMGTWGSFIGRKLRRQPAKDAATFYKEWYDSVDMDGEPKRYLKKHQAVTLV